MIIVKIWEGLGNQLFQYAFAKNLQMQGREVYLDSDFSTKASLLQQKREYRLNYFNISLKEASEKQKKKYCYIHNNNIGNKIADALDRICLLKYRRVEQTNPFSYDEMVNSVYRNCYIQGWFQNSKYLETIRNILLKEISPKHKIKINASLKRLINENKVVAVHIRRGDYLRCQICLRMNYYHNAMKYMSEQLEKPHFLFFSDDMKWVHEYFGKKENYFYIDDFGEYADYEELLIMSRCKNIIIANSTFSWWAAWLNKCEEKIVIAPKRWNKSVSIEETNQLVPDEWIRI